MPLTDPHLFAVNADWAPSGDLIAYSALAQAGATDPDLFTIRPDGTGVTRITTLADSGGAAEEPGWLPNGTAIFFDATFKDGRGLAKVSSGGGTVSPAIGDTYINALHPRLVMNREHRWVEHFGQITHDYGRRAGQASRAVVSAC